MKRYIKNIKTKDNFVQNLKKGFYVDNPKNRKLGRVGLPYKEGIFDVEIDKTKQELEGLKTQRDYLSYQDKDTSEIDNKIENLKIKISNLEIDKENFKNKKQKKKGKKEDLNLQRNYSEAYDEEKEKNGGNKRSIKRYEYGHKNSAYKD